MTVENGPRPTNSSLEAVKDMEFAYLYTESNTASKGDIVDTLQIDQGLGRVSPESASARKFGLYTREPRWYKELG